MRKDYTIEHEEYDDDSSPLGLIISLFLVFVCLFFAYVAYEICKASGFSHFTLGITVAGTFILGIFMFHKNGMFDARLTYINVRHVKVWHSGLRKGIRTEYPYLKNKPEEEDDGQTNAL